MEHFDVVVAGAGPAGRLAVVTNNGRQDIREASVSLPPFVLSSLHEPHSHRPHRAKETNKSPLFQCCCMVPPALWSPSTFDPMLVNGAAAGGK